MNIITTEADLDACVQAYLNADFAFDVETVGDDRLNTRINQVLWISLATHGRVDVIPMGHPNGEFLHWDKPLLAEGRRRQAAGKELRDRDYSHVQEKWQAVFSDPPDQLLPSQVWQALSPVFANDQTIKVAHNAKFDIKSIHKYLGFMPQGDYFDTMIAAFCLASDREKGLDKVLNRVFGYQMEKGIGKQVEKHSFADVARYAGLDARWTWLLANRLTTLIEEYGVGPVFDLEMDTLRVVISMETHGVRIDEDSLHPLRDSLTEQLNEMKLRVFECAGCEFAINSPTEKAKILFGPRDEGGQGLKPVKTTTTGKPSVDADVLVRLKKNKVAAALLEYAEINKLLTTYVTPYTGGTAERVLGGKVKEVEVKSLLQDGRIYGNFNQVGADTGRFSSSSPNLQNVPNASTDNGRAIRNLFIADPGHKLIVADFSQIEPRIIASLSDDERMIQAFQTGEDIYLAVAEPLGVNRAAGKQLVLSIAYGIGPDSVAERLGIQVKQARKLMDDFSKEFKSIEALRRKVITNARNQKNPHSRTYYGRIRNIPQLVSSDTRDRARAERQCFNALIQGTAADIMKKALVRTHNLLPHGSHIVMTVHDELIVTAPDADVEVAAKAVREGMTGIDDFKVPLEIDLKVVDRWGQAK